EDDGTAHHLRALRVGDVEAHGEPRHDLHAERFLHVVQDVVGAYTGVAGEHTTFLEQVPRVLTGQLEQSQLLAADGYVRIHAPARRLGEKLLDDGSVLEIAAEQYLAR